MPKDMLEGVVFSKVDDLIIVLLVTNAEGVCCEVVDGDDVGDWAVE